MRLNQGRCQLSRFSAICQPAGLSAYDVATGRLQAASTARDYTAVYALPSGRLLAIASDNPRLSFFDSSLRQLGTEDTNLNVVEVY